MGCAREGSPPAAASREQPLLESGEVFFADGATRLRFPVPELGVSVTAEHFDDPTLEDFKFRHEISVTGSNGVAVLIHVWNNSAHVPFETWFADNMQFMVDQDGVGVSEQPFTRVQAPGVLIEMPMSPQAPSMAAAIFAFRDQIYRVTCIDYQGAGGPEARNLFFRVLDNLELEVKP